MGVIGLENIVFPHEFKDEFCAADQKYSYTGVAARRDIHHREAILAVPFDIIISRKTFEKEEPELYQFCIENCPDLFVENEQQDYEQLLITFFLMTEIVKGKASKWYPYLSCLPEGQTFFCDWDKKIIEACQDKQL